MPPSGLVASLTTLQAGHRDGRGVGAVGGVGREDLGAGLAAILVVGAGEQDPGELAVRAGGGLQADVRQARDLAEGRLEVPHQLERALRAFGVLQRVQARVAGQRGDALVQARVVLHRARAERVEAGVEVEVALGEAHVVAHDLRLGELRQPRRLGAAQLAEQLRGVDRGDVERGALERAPTGRAALEDREHGLLRWRRRLALIARTAGRAREATRTAGRVQCLASMRARRRGPRRTPPRLARGGDGGPEDVGEPVDVGAVAALGERDQQPAAVGVAAGERVQVGPGVDPVLAQRRLTAATSTSASEAQRELADDGLVVQGLDAVQRGERLARVVGAREQQLAELDDPRRPSQAR